MTWGISLVSYVGCLITIAALALDPLTQQILAYTSNSQALKGPRSSVPISHAYDNGDTGVTGATGGSISSSRDSDVLAAAVSGIYGIQPTPPFACPGANCTFPAFQTLGVRSSPCTDVTEKTVQTCDNDWQDRDPSVTGDLLTNCTYQTPGGFELYSRSYYDVHHGFGYTSINTTFNMSAEAVTGATFLSMGIVTFDNSDMLSDDADASDITWQSTLRAYECLLDVVAMSFDNYTYLNGALQNGTLRTSALNNTGGFADGTTAVIMNTLDETFPGNQTYLVNVFDFQAIEQGLMSVLAPEPSSTSIFAQALYNTGDVLLAMDYMAEAMTYRLMQGPNSTTVYGDVLENETYIRVRWPWLSLTFVLVLISAVFLLITVFITYRSRQYAWKSSLAPLMYADSSLRSLTIKGALGRTWTTEQRAKRVDTIRSGLMK